ncbi:DUF3990 domain-containing protein [Clostridium sp.]|uniref:DUF3990 domain-containing protein n=1 Tax=Clostridium sp. TaxID=1506 RepID=UPI003F3F82AB
MEVINEALLEKDLYHGTVNNFTKPDLSKSIRSLDFGRGFYLTTIEEQARIFAKSIEDNRPKNSEFAGKRINVYSFEKEKRDMITIKSYEDINIDWMYYIIKCRSEMDDMEGIDIVMGPVADGRGRELINKSRTLMKDLQEESLTKEELEEELNDLISDFKFNKYSNQIVLKTEKAIDSVKYKRIISIR